MSELRRLRHVEAREGFSVAVTWEDGEQQIVDLSPYVLSFKLFRPLRKDRKLFEDVRLIEFGRAIAWGDGDEIDFPVSSIENLA